MTKDRRNFIKKAGLAVGAIGIAGQVNAAKLITTEFDKLNLPQEQRDFLSNLSEWVNRYYDVVMEERKKGAFKDNNKITALADEAESWMPKAAPYLDNPTFKKHFLDISFKLSDAITEDY
jgi:hypothetical protein